SLSPMLKLITSMILMILTKTIADWCIKKKLVLMVILLIAFAARFFHIGQIPDGIHPDEAYAAYNAFFITYPRKTMMMGTLFHQAGSMKYFLICEILQLI
ncbi:MAG: hypothetical protein ACI4EJ_07935, partial [Bacteroides sp.]